MLHIFSSDYSIGPSGLGEYRRGCRLIGHKRVDQGFASLGAGFHDVRFSLHALGFGVILLRLGFLHVDLHRLLELRVFGLKLIHGQEPLV